MTTYQSKIGLELTIPFSILIGGIGAAMIYEKDWINVAILLMISLFIVHMLTTTYYQINGDTLIIRCGFLYNKSLKIESIKKIIETRNPISSPAASLDRLELVYNTFDSVLVSPKDKMGFINELLRLKPGIEVRLKDRKNS